MDFTKTIRGGDANTYFTIRLENERYRVKIFYPEPDFYKLRENHRIDPDDISVSIK